MLKIKIFVILSIFVTSCSEFEFVYNQNNELETLKNKLTYIASGDDSDLLLLELKNKYGKNFNKAKFILSATIEKNIDSISIDSDGTASRKEIEYKVLYKIDDAEKKCIVLIKTIYTKSTFSTKSSGYNFSTDLSQIDSEKNNIRLNISEFSDYLVSLRWPLNCSNEN